MRWSLPRLSLTLLLFAALAWALAHLADVSRPLETLAVLWASPVLLAVFLGTYTAAFFCRAVAWRLLLPPASRRPVPRLFGILQVSLGANHLFPAKVGELVRVGLLARTGVPVSVAAGSTVVARLLDVAALCLIALVVGPVAGGSAGARAPFEALTAPLSLACLAGGGGLLGARLLGARLLGARLLGARLLGAGQLVPRGNRLSAPAARLVRVARDALAGAAATPPWQLTAAAALTFSSWLLEAGALWSVASAAGVSLTPAGAATATAVTIAFQGLQFTPGGLGLYETILTGALAVLGVDPAAALSLALATHALKFAYSYGAGALCLGALALADARSPAPSGPAPDHARSSP